MKMFSQKKGLIAEDLVNYLMISMLTLSAP